MAHFLRAKNLSNEPLPDGTEEMIIALATGWTLEEIRSLSESDFMLASVSSRVYLRVLKERSETKI